MKPYLAVVFASRNDEYPPNQSIRIRKFIEYYAYYEERYPDLFEFIICDWNPPPDKESLKNAFPWNLLKRVSHITISPETHKRLCPDGSRPILDFTARNVCIRKATAPYILVMNQDIFLSSSIIEFLAEKKLSDRYFYRADRCDFNDDDPEFSDWGSFDSYAKNRALVRHTRPLCYTTNMSVPLGKGDFDRVYTRKTPLEYRTGNILYSDYYSYCRPLYNGIYKIYQSVKRAPETYFEKFFLHTNASGDFLIAPKKAFDDVHGFIESYRFYLHIDSYMCLQLFAAGYKQAILAYPHTAFHSDHSRTARESRPESMTYLEHIEKFNHICLGKYPYRLNPESWGLKNETVQTG